MTQMKDLTLPTGQVYPVLPLRDIVVFPHMIVPLFVGRDKAVQAVDSVMRKDQKVLLVTQKDPANDSPSINDLFNVGILANILQFLKMPDGTVKVLVEGLVRVSVLKFIDNGLLFQAHAEALVETESAQPRDIEVLSRTALGLFEQYVKISSKITPDVLPLIAKIENPSKLADSIGAHLQLKIPEKQQILEIVGVAKRLEKICEFMESEVSMMNTEKKIRKRVKSQMEKSQRDYYLNEQLKAIQKELGESEDEVDEIKGYEEKLKKFKLPLEAADKVKYELKKLKTMNPLSSEANVVRHYLDWLLGIPWQQQSKVQKDLKKAQKILDQDHYGLEKVKERIVEYLAVQQKVGKIKGPILCLVGPPGVGKTSLGKSIAKATNRAFVRVALGGVRDESEIRGHRRTYIGSLPGRIIQGMKKAGKSNPLFLLDEIDKLGQDWRGDPSAALLEVLDPEQNNAFNDHYLEVDYDLSDVMFVTTANSLNIPHALLDRVEVIRLAGYTEDEKLEICKHHLFNKQLEAHGLKVNELQISDAVFTQIIRKYTREAGVRNLEREIAKLCRKAAKSLLTDKARSIIITEENLGDYLGVSKFKYGEIEKEDMVGITTGLAWTEVGGEILTIESLMVPGKGKMTITGKLGEVMQESVQAAASFVRSRSTHYGIIPTVFEKRDIHVHVPEGAIPKDGPSAGVAMITSIVSVLTGIPVLKDVAMTGEITLRGRVLAIGGLKEKLLAAHRGGIRKVIIPAENEKDLIEIPDNIKQGLEIICVDNVDDVLKHALKTAPQSIIWEEDIVIPRNNNDITHQVITAH